VLAASGLGQIGNCDHVVLLCRDLGAMRRFYAETMRFALRIDTAAWVSFGVGATLLSLRPRGRSRAGEDGPAAPGAACVHLAFRVPPGALDACHDELVAKDVAIASPPAEIPSWRHRALFFHDPEGNVVEIYAEV
jgi:glyoxylase I family protein